MEQKNLATFTHFKGVTRLEIEWNIYAGDACEVLKILPDATFDCVVTSPPYFWLRDYGVDDQIGHEDTVQSYVNAITDVMTEVHRVLSPEGLLFLNLGDTIIQVKANLMA